VAGLSRKHLAASRHWCERAGVRVLLYDKIPHPPCASARGQEGRDQMLPRPSFTDYGHHNYGSATRHIVQPDRTLPRNPLLGVRLGLQLEPPLHRLKGLLAASADSLTIEASFTMVRTIWSRRPCNSSRRETEGGIGASGDEACHWGPRVREIGESPRRAFIQPHPARGASAHDQ